MISIFSLLWCLVKWIRNYFDFISLSILPALYMCHKVLLWLCLKECLCILLIDVKLRHWLLCKGWKRVAIKCVITQCIYIFVYHLIPMFKQQMHSNIVYFFCHPPPKKPIIRMIHNSPIAYFIGVFNLWLKWPKTPTNLIDTRLSMTCCIWFILPKLLLLNS